MLHKMKGAALAFVVVLLSAAQAMATTNFPVSTGSQTAIDNVILDIVAWATAFLVVILTVTGYKYIKRIARG